MKKILSLLLLTLAIGNHLQAQQPETDTLPPSPMRVPLGRVYEHRSPHFNRPVATFTQLLQGTTAGVQVSEGGSNASVDSRLLVRGASSIILPNDPIVIVDGMPYTGGMVSLNVLDIESITIHKDAPTTVLYGSRGANGVVEVTTKQGGKGKARVNLRMSQGVSSRGVADYERVGVKDFLELKRESLHNTYLYRGYTPTAAALLASKNLLKEDYLNSSYFTLPQGEVMLPNGKMNPNARLYFDNNGWEEALFRTGIRSEYAVDASGGTDHATYFLSLGHLNDKGYLRHNDAQRYNARANATLTPVHWLRLGLNLSGAIQEVNSPTETSSISPIEFARRVGPIYPVYQYGGYNQSGDYAFNDAVFEGYNPAVSLANSARTEDGKKLAAILSAQFTLTKGVILDVSGGIERNTTRLDANGVSYRYDAYPAAYQKQQQDFDATSRSWQLKSQLSYSLRDESGTNAFKAFAGFEKISHSFHTSNFESTITYDEYYGKYSQTYFLWDKGTTIDKDIKGYFAGFTYSYADKFFLQPNIRVESEEEGTYFPTGEKVFWSLGGAWAISEEDFLKQIRWIDMLKLSFSHGKVGKDDISNHFTWQTKSPRESFINATFPYFFGLVNTAKLTDISLDMSAFENRLRLNATYFRKEVADIVPIRAPLSPTTGLHLWTQDFGSKLNRGVELYLSGVPLQAGDVRWELTLNLTSYKSKLTGPTNDYQYTVEYKGVRYHTNQGNPYEFYLPSYVGVNPTNGAPMYLAGKQVVNDSRYQYKGTWVTESPNIYDYFTQGSAIPDLFGGIGSSLQYKNLHLSLLLSYQLGGKVYDYAYQQLMQWQPTNGYTMHTDLLNRWQKEGDITNVPRDGSTISRSDFYLASASYLSLRSVVLAYTLPQKWISKRGLRQVEVYAAGENLLMLSARKGLYPTANFYGIAGNEYPPARTVALGINVGF